MASETTNYKLVKPDPEEFYDVGVQNSNLDKIDTALKELEDSKASSTDLMQLQQEFMSHKADSGRHEYVLFSGALTSGSASFTFPEELDSISHFDELVIYIGSTLSYGSTTLTVKPKTLFVHTYAVLSGGVPNVYWLRAQSTESGITILYNRKTRADGTEFEIETSDTWINGVEGVKYG